MARVTRSPSVENDNLVVVGAPATNLGATPSLDLTDTPYVWHLGTLNANATLSVEGFIAGHRLVLHYKQDATGGRTLALDDGSGPVALTIIEHPDAPVWVVLEWITATEVHAAALTPPGASSELSELVTLTSIMTANAAGGMAFPTAGGVGGYDNEPRCFSLGVEINISGDVIHAESLALVAGSTYTLGTLDAGWRPSVPGETAGVAINGDFTVFTPGNFGVTEDGTVTFFAFADAAASTNITFSGSTRYLNADVV